MWRIPWIGGSASVRRPLAACGRHTQEGTLARCFGKASGARGSPANPVRFSRSHATVQQSPMHRQETQIVQPCNQLADFLSGF